MDSGTHNPNANILGVKFNVGTPFVTKADILRIARDMEFKPTAVYPIFTRVHAPTSVWALEAPDYEVDMLIGSKRQEEWITNSLHVRVTRVRWCHSCAGRSRVDPSLTTPQLTEHIAMFARSTNGMLDNASSVLQLVSTGPINANLAKIFLRKYRLNTKVHDPVLIGRARGDKSGLVVFFADTAEARRAYHELNGAKIGSVFLTAIPIL